ncbi:hypothetical protein [Dryocola sp. BD626]|uniref:hypothetical protein n=1 Tax=Dryocola sp. BD626 TaxID=3133273 RepID=UPI003F50AB8F
MHLHAANLLDTFALLMIDVPDMLILRLDAEQLPADWADSEALTVLAQTGDE